MLHTTVIFLILDRPKYNGYRPAPPPPQQGTSIDIDIGTSENGQKPQRRPRPRPSQGTNIEIDIESSARDRQGTGSQQPADARVGHEDQQTYEAQPYDRLPNNNQQKYSQPAKKTFLENKRV